VPRAGDFSAASASLRRWAATVHLPPLARAGVALKLKRNGRKR